MAAKKRRRRKAKKHFCVMAGKKKLSCHATKSAAKKVARARQKRGVKGRVVKRAMKR